MQVMQELETSISQSLIHLLNKEVRMKKFYNSPAAEMVEFDTQDVITTSPSILDTFTGESANEDNGWTGLY